MKLKATLISVLALIASNAAFATNAGTWTNVTVTDIFAFTNEGSPANVVEVLFSATAGGNPPGCSANNRTYAIVDMSTAGGAYAAALLQTAKLAGATVQVLGAGNCNLVGGIETIAYVEE